MIVDDLGQRGRLVADGEITHRYPVCWRCGTELIYRLVDEWFIGCDEMRQPMIDAAGGVEWTPPQYGKRMEDWLRNMGDWCISRKRYWGLPLPFYFCEDGHLTVVGSKAELCERAVRGTEGLDELHRPWIDDVVIRCGECAGDARRVADVGDAWLDAGIVPFSTLGWHNEAFVEGGYAEGAGVGVTVADLPDHAHWEKWYPADWVSEMREQIRLWFYSMLFMGVTLDGRSPYRRVLTYEKVNDETGRPMHKSWGNAIWFEDAIEEMGADVMRWMYAAQPPAQNLNFGYGRAGDVKKRLLTLWNTYAFFVTYAGINGFQPDAATLAAGPAPEGIAAARPLGRRPHPGPRARVPRGARHLRLAAARPGLRGPRRRPLELVRAALALAVLEVRRRGVDARGPRDALVCARPGGAVRRAGHAVPGRRDVAEPRARPVCRCGAERPPRAPIPSRSTPSTTRNWWRRSTRCGRSSSSAAGRARRPT